MAIMFESQLNELQKLSYDFYRTLAKGEEPLTYSFVENDGAEHQVEVSVEIGDANNIMVEIAFDTYYKARFDKSKGNFFRFKLNSKNQWQSIAATKKDLS